MLDFKVNAVSYQEDIEGALYVTLRVDKEHRQLAKGIVQKLRESGKELFSATLKVFREKRSLDANSYLWVLLGKIADAVGSDRDSVYFEMLKRYGQGAVLKIPNKDVDNFKRAYKYHEKHESLPDEERAQYFRFWVGSSQYNTEEMSILIDGVVSEAQELGIDVRTPDEIARMCEQWGAA